MSLKDDKQQNTQIELDFSSALTGEAREAGREGLSRPGRRLEPKTQPAFRPYSRNASVTVSNRRVRTVRTVVWQGSAGDRRPYADHRGQEGGVRPHSLDGPRDSRGPANMMPRHAASRFACIACAQLVQFRKWPIPCGARLPLPPCQPRRFVRGTVRSFALLIGSPPYVSWLCSSAELKFSSLTRASIGVKPATY